MLMLALKRGMVPSPGAASGWHGLAHDGPLVDGKVHDHGNHRQPDRDQPHELVRAGAVEEVDAEPAAEETAELMEEEHEAREHGEMLHAENPGDDAVGERHRAEP